MAPFDFEKHLKQKLDSREITPSKSAWEKVAEELPEAAPSGSNINWYLMAAVITGLLVALAYFVKPGDSIETISVERSIADSADEEENATDIERPASTLVPAVIVEQNTLETEVFTDNEAPSEIIQPDKQEVAVSEEQELWDEEETISQEIVTVQEPLEEQSAQDTSKEAITDVEVEKLLLQAKQRIAKRESSEESREVDAAQLLARAEEEVEDSFRDRIFERMKDGFVIVKSAVASRNN